MFKFCGIQIRIKKRLFVADFQLPSHGIVFLEGENGSGKSTILKCLMGYRRYKGDIAIDDQRFKGGFFSRRTSIRTNIAYLTPDTRKEFSGVKFSTLYRRNPSDVALTLLSKIDLPTETDYDLLSSGERSLFHLAYALLYPRSVLILDELLSSLSIERLNQLTPFLENLKKDTLLIITSQKKIEGIDFDAHYAIEEQRVETKVEPFLEADTGKILRYKYKKTNKSVVVMQKNDLKPVLINLILLGGLFSSFALVYNDDYTKYKEELGRTHFVDVWTSKPDHRMENQTRTILKMNSKHINGYEYLRFIASDVPGYTADAVSYFHGVNFSAKEASLKEFMQNYFDISVSKLRESIPLKDKLQIFVTEAELAHIQTKVLYFSGEYLSKDLADLVGNPRVKLNAGANDLDYYVTNGEPILMGSRYTGNINNQCFNNIGYLEQNSNPFGPVIAYTNVASFERYSRDRLFGTPTNVSCATLKYFKYPQNSIKLSLSDLSLLHDELVPGYVLPIIFLGFFLLISLSVNLQKKNIEESLYLESGAPLRVRLFKSVRPGLYACIMMALLSSFVFYTITFTPLFGSISLLYSILACCLFTPLIALIYIACYLIRQQVISHLS